MAKRQSILKDRYFLIAFVLFLASIVGAYWGIRQLSKKTDTAPEDSGTCQSQIPDDIDMAFISDYSADNPWWDDEYANFKQITLENKSTSTTLSTDCYTIIQFDHSAFVKDKRSRADAYDLKLVYLENGKYSEIATDISDSNTNKVKIAFLPMKEIPGGGKDENYFLYYGNSGAKKPGTNTDQYSRLYAQNYRIYVNREVYPKISGKVSRHWLLKETEIDPQYSVLNYTVSIDESIKIDQTPEYQLIGTDIKGKLEKIFKGEYEINIDTNNIPTGSYKIQTVVKSEGKKLTSNKSHISVSYPLYVAWTMDWEGIDASDEELNNLSEFSKKHGIPITHFFNPRIYVTSEVSEERADALTQWIYIRQTNGDEIGIHLHMHHDMVEAAGVTPRKTPKWTDHLNNGHDVPCTAYTKKEFSKILSWAKEKVIAQGLETPVSFRAGGWFADLKVLEALEENGFIIDSSGRDSYIWGANALRGYWNLTSTTHPYQPSRTNQNITSSNHFTLWEFPNNGTDSWFHNSDDLIARFNDNFQKAPIDRAQVLTYLSHPHQIHKDIEVLEPTYTYIDKYLANIDQGPVIYITQKEAYLDLMR